MTARLGVQLQQRHALRRYGAARADVTGGWLVGAKSEYPLRAFVCPICRHEGDEREPSTIMVVKALVHTGRDAAFLFAVIRPIHTAATQKTPSHAIRLSYRDAGVESAPTMMAFPRIPHTTNRPNLAAWT